MNLIGKVAGAKGQDEEKPIEPAPQRPVDIFADSPGSTANRIRERRKKMQEELDKINK